MAAVRSRIVKAFCGLAVAFGGAGAHLVYTQYKNRQANASLVVLPRPGNPFQSHVNGASGDGAASAALGEPALTMPLVLPPASRRSSTPESVDEGTRRELMAQCADAAALGLPSDAEVRCYGSYIASLNYERKVPNWVLESMRSRSDKTKTGAKGERETASDNKTAVSRNRSAFYADPTVPAAYRVHPTDYDGARGLSRGHLAAAQLHKGSQLEMDATFNMNANIVPQDMTCNAVDWLRLESLVRRLSREVVKAQKSSPVDAAESSEGRLLIVTGPAYVAHDVRIERRGPAGRVAEVPLSAPPSTFTTAHRRVVSYEVVGKSGVAVPTHLFKVILAERPHKLGSTTPIYEAAAFLLPNKAIPEERPLTDYQVSPVALERLTGLRFFPGLAQGIGSLPDLCRSHICEAKGSALFEKYRHVAQLRSADTIPQLRGIYSALEKSSDGAPLDEAVKKEFNRRMEELAAEATASLD